MLSNFRKKNSKFKKIKNSSNLVLVESQEEHLSDNMVIAPRLYYKSGHLYVIHEIKILQEFDSFIVQWFIYMDCILSSI